MGDENETLPKLPRNELVEITRRLIACEGTEEEMDEWLDLLGANVPHPEIATLIYYTEPELDPEEIIDQALGYKSILLGSRK